MAGTAVDGDPSAVRAHDVPGDREAEARPRHPGGPRRGAVELVEDPPLVFRRDADAPVRDGDLHRGAAPPHPQPDAAATPRVLHRVVQEVHEDLGHRRGIDTDLGQPGVRRSHRDREPPVGAPRFDRRQRGPDDVLDRRRLRTVTDLRRLDAAEAQHVVDEPSQAGGLLLDAPSVLGDAVRRGHAPPAQQFAEHRDRRQRRAHLVGHAGHEPVPDPREPPLAPRRPPREQHAAAGQHGHQDRQDPARRRVGLQHLGGGGVAAPRRQLEVAEHEIEAARQHVGLARPVVRGRHDAPRPVGHAQEQVVPHVVGQPDLGGGDGPRQELAFESAPVDDETGETDRDRVGVGDEPVEDAVPGVQLVHVDLRPVQVQHPLQAQQGADPQGDELGGAVGGGADPAGFGVVITGQARASIEGPREQQARRGSVDPAEVPRDDVEPPRGEGVPRHVQHLPRRVLVRPPHAGRHRVQMVEEGRLVGDGLHPRQPADQLVLHGDDRQQGDEDDGDFEPPPTEKGFKVAHAASLTCMNYTSP